MIMTGGIKRVLGYLLYKAGGRLVPLVMAIMMMGSIRRVLNECKVTACTERTVGLFWRLARVRKGSVKHVSCYLLYRAGSRFVLVVGQNEEGKRAELRMLQGRVKLRTRHLQILLRRSAVQNKHDPLRALVVPAPVLFN